MKIFGIISEYNPFHNGHQYMISQLRKNGATHIVAIMGGDYLQRGDVSLIDKWAKTRCALKGGVDLVIELPVPYATAGAERFALGGVQTINGLGCIDNLAFGSECGSIEILKGIAQLTTQPQFLDKVKALHGTGFSYPKAMEEVAKRLTNAETAAHLSNPNNVLAIEYIKALYSTGSPVTPVTIKREGGNHDTAQTINSIASASHIRQLFLKGDNTYSKLIPSFTKDILNNELRCGNIATLQQAQRAILYKLRSMNRQDFSQLPDVSEGLDNRIFNAISQCTNLDDLYKAIKTKRYTHARIRRIIMYAFLGISQEIQQQPVQYIRVLGFNKHGIEVLKKAKSTATLPVITKISNSMDSLTPSQQQALLLDIKCSDYYSLFTSKVISCGKDYKIGIIRQ